MGTPPPTLELGRRAVMPTTNLLVSEPQELASHTRSRRTAVCNHLGATSPTPHSRTGLRFGARRFDKHAADFG